ncbi:uncharacterized protein UDID_00784 [Ustilago sp. UG-2017a]|nr:uncharacterized protein UDID_00784 [Ustilago sp. UG-2017a]
MSYATLNIQFGLPPPPPKSVFSTINNVEGRAWFPDFTQDEDPVGSLKQFLRVLFYPVLCNSTFIQLKVLSVLAAVIGIWIFLIVVRRFYQKTFWLFRLVVRSNGSLIVPNAITTFVAIESIFVILLIALLCTTVGIVYARPDALSFVSPQPGKPQSRALRMGITPSVVNVFVFCIPVIQIVSIVVPAAFAQHRFTIAFEHYHRWSDAIQAGATLSREMLLEAQQIWFKVLDAAYYISNCMAVWESWVCLLFICYCLAGGSLITTLRAQLATFKSFTQNCSFSESGAGQNGKNGQLRRPRDVFANIVVSEDTQGHGEVDIEKQTATSPTTPNLLSVQAPPRSFSISSAVSDSATLVSGRAGIKRSASQSNANGNLMPTARPTGPDNDNVDTIEVQTASMYFTQQELRNQNQPSNSFFPAVRPSAFERPAQAQTQAGKQNSQKRYLEKFYTNFLVQFVGLMLCILFFVVFVGKLITTWYSAWEANDFASALQIALLVVVWVTVVLASIIIFAILSRTYEPVLSNLNAASNSRSGGSRRESLAQNNNASIKSASFGAGRRLSGAKAWATSTLTQLPSGVDRRSQDIGLDRMRSSLSGRDSRSASLSGFGRPSLHAYAELDGEHDSPRVDHDPPSPKGQPLSLCRSKTSSTTQDLQASSSSPTKFAHEPHRQRSFRSSASSSSTSKGSKASNGGGVMVEQAVSTIVEDPAVEEYYRVERPCKATRSSPSKSDISEQGIYTPHMLDSILYTPSRFSRQSEWADSPVTPATMWSPSTPSSTRPLVSKKDAGRESPDEVIAADGEDWVRHRSRSGAALRGLAQSQPDTAGDASVGLDIGMTSTPWTAPPVWGSGEPDEILKQEDQEMRVRMATRPSTANSRK